MKIRFHHEAHEGHEEIQSCYTLELRALATFVVRYLFLLWLRRHRAVPLW
jgi:hypothetical protein